MTFFPKTEWKKRCRGTYEGTYDRLISPFDDSSSYGQRTGRIDDRAMACGDVLDTIFDDGVPEDVQGSAFHMRSHEPSSTGLKRG